MQYFSLPPFLFITPTWAVSALPVKGIVQDARTGEPLVGATVRVKGTTQGTVTNLDGSFVLKESPTGQPCTLEASYIGYVTTEHQITAKAASSEIIIALAENARELGEVVVKGSYQRETDENARSLERRAENVMNVVSAKAIQISPDITVANVIQTGVGHFGGAQQQRRRSARPLCAAWTSATITRWSMGKDSSPDNKYRYVPLDIFPAELLDRLEVTKSLTPAMEGDALAGRLT